MTDTPLDFGLNEVVTEALARVSTQAVVCRFYAPNPIGIGTNHEHKGRVKPFLSKKSRSETDRGKARPNACPTSPFGGQDRAAPTLPLVAGESQISRTVL